MKSVWPLLISACCLLILAPAKAQEGSEVNQLLVQKQFSKAFDLANQKLKDKPDANSYLNRGNAYWSICD